MLSRLNVRVLAQYEYRDSVDEDLKYSSMTLTPPSFCGRFPSSLAKLNPAYSATMIIAAGIMLPRMLWHPQMHDAIQMTPSVHAVGPELASHLLVVYPYCTRTALQLTRYCSHTHETGPS